jgi:hypothetical protein
MSAHFHWIDTTGGPHVLGAVECLDGWRGIEDWHPGGREDSSDYARACRVQGYLGKVLSAGAELVVLSGDRGPIARIPYPDGGGGVLIQCLASDGDHALFALLSDWEAKDPDKRPYTENLEFDTGQSGMMALFDSTQSGSKLNPAEREIVTLRLGRYQLFAAYVETAHCVVVLRELIPRFG